MESPRCLDAAQGEVLVEYRQFLLQGGGPDAREIHVPDDEGSGIAVTGGPGGLLLRSAANDHYVLVRFERWSGEPPPNHDGWEVTRDSAFTVSDGSPLYLSELFGSNDPPEITMPAPGRYLVRAYVWGCRAASERGEAEFFRDVERWLMHIWPAGDGAPMV